MLDRLEDYPQNTKLFLTSHVLTSYHHRRTISRYASFEKLTHPICIVNSQDEPEDILRCPTKCGLVLITRCYPHRRYGTRGCNLAEARIEDERREGRRAVRKDDLRRKDREGGGRRRSKDEIKGTSN